MASISSRGGTSGGSSVASPGPGDAGKFLAVNDAENGFELVPAPAGGGGGCSYRSFHWGAGLDSGALDFSAATLEETDGDALTINGSGQLVAQADGVYTFSLAATATDPADATFISFSFSDNDSPSWGPVIDVPIINNRGTAQAAYRFGVGDVFSFHIAIDGSVTTFSGLNCWVTGPA